MFTIVPNLKTIRELSIPYTGRRHVLIRSITRKTKMRNRPEMNTGSDTNGKKWSAIRRSTRKCIPRMIPTEAHRCGWIDGSNSFTPTNMISVKECPSEAHSFGRIGGRNPFTPTSTMLVKECPSTPKSTKARKPEESKMTKWPNFNKSNFIGRHSVVNSRFLYYEISVNFNASQLQLCYKYMIQHSRNVCYFFRTSSDAL